MTILTEEQILTKGKNVWTEVAKNIPYTKLKENVISTMTDFLVDLDMYGGTIKKHYKLRLEIH